MAAWEKWVATTPTLPREPQLEIWMNLKKGMMERIWDHAKATPEAKGEARFLIRNTRREKSWVDVAKEVTKILDNETETAEKQDSQRKPNGGQ